jgi:hypothetical protein
MLCTEIYHFIAYLRRWNESNAEGVKTEIRTLFFAIEIWESFIWYRTGTLHFRWSTFTTFDRNYKSYFELIPTSIRWLFRFHILKIVVIRCIFFCTCFIICKNGVGCHQSLLTICGQLYSMSVSFQSLWQIFA